MKIQKSRLVLSIPLIIIFTAIVFWAAGINNNENYKIGIVEIDEVDVASKIPGRIEELNVREGDFVSKGQILARLESKEIDAKVGQAKGVLEAAEAKYNMVMKGVRDEEKRGAEGLYHQAENAYNEAMAYHSELQLISPIDGQISNKIADQGEIIASGYPVFTIINPEEYYIVLQIREDELSNIKIGEYFYGTISALENKQIEFKVTYISPMADFATWKPTNQKGDFDLKTYEIHLKSDEPIENIKPGMTVKISL